MAAFTSLENAEARARVLMASPSALVAHSARRKDGVIVVRVLRPMPGTGVTFDGMNRGGAWDEITDDAGV